MKKSVASAPSPRAQKRRSRKKNGGSHSAGSGARSRVPAGGDFCRAAQVRDAGFGSRGDGHTRGLAPGGGGGAGGVAGRPRRLSSPSSLRLWAGGTLPRQASEATADRA